MNALEKIPEVGFGFWKVDTAICADTAYEAIKAGYRHLDCAADYGNEKEVGEGIQRAIKDGLCTREELWITSKLWNTFHAPEHVPLALEKNIERFTARLYRLVPYSFPNSAKVCTY